MLWKMSETAPGRFLAIWFPPLLSYLVCRVQLSGLRRFNAIYAATLLHVCSLGLIQKPHQFEIYLLWKSKTGVLLTDQGQM